MPLIAPKQAEQPRISGARPLHHRSEFTGLGWTACPHICLHQASASTQQPGLLLPDKHTSEEGIQQCQHRARRRVAPAGNVQDPARETSCLESNSLLDQVD